MRICSPVARPPAASLAMKARPATLEGLRIGLLDNTKAPVDKLLAHLGGHLQERIPTARIHAVSKAASGKPAGDALLGELAANCDVLINALAD